MGETELFDRFIVDWRQWRRVVFRFGDGGKLGDRVLGGCVGTGWVGEGFSDELLDVIWVDSGDPRGFLIGLYL